METILQTTNLSKEYSKVKVVNQVTMSVSKGDIYGFIGKNGAGKTTLIRMLVGLAQPNEGSISLFGSSDLVSQRNKIGTVIEYPALMQNLTAAQNLEIQRRLLNIPDKSTIQEVLKEVGLANTGKKKAKNFSLGMKQRLAIALALMGDPEFLILDEPTNGLDPTGIKEIRELILRLNKERGITVLISTHILGELSRLATRYGIIHNGVLIEEFTEEELNKRCQSNLVIKTSNMDNVMRVLKEDLHIENFNRTSDNEFIITDFVDSPSTINEALAKRQLFVDSISVSTTDLEEYFIKTIGDANI